MHNFGVSSDAGGSRRLVRFSAPSGVTIPNVPIELDLSGFRERIAFTYFFETYSWAYFWKPLIRVQENNVTPLEHESSLALVYGYFGLGNHDRDTEVRGLELYGDLIRQVKSVLGRGSKDELAKLTVSVLILGMFTYAVDRDLILQHHLGVSQIFEYCGPRYFAQEPLLSAFRSGRRVLTCQALAEHSRIFLEREEWKTLPFELHQKNASDFLNDVLADMPGIVEDIENLQQARSLVSRDQLAHKVAFLSKKLELWCLEWRQANGNTINQRTPQPLSWGAKGNQKDHIKDVLGHPLDFKTFEDAFDILTYNAALLYLMQLEEALQGTDLDGRLLSRHDLDHLIRIDNGGLGPALLTPSEIKFFGQPAVAALRTFPYLHRHWIAEGGKVIAIQAPVGIVYCVVQRQPELRDLVEWESLLPVFDDNSRRDLRGYEVFMDKPQHE